MGRTTKGPELVKKIRDILRQVIENRKSTLAREQFIRTRAQRQWRKWKRNRKDGHLKRARELSEEAKRLKNKRLAQRDRQDGLLNKLRTLKTKAEALRWSTAWGGSKGAAQWMKRKAAEQGWVPPISSLKRDADHPLSLSNPGSDHNKANKRSYAVDFATYEGASFAHRLAEAIGWHDYSTGSYNTFTWYTKHGTYRVQILWAVSGHYDHVHLGIQRVD